MVVLGIPDSEIKSAMARGVYDLLTVIPIDQLEKGVVFVRTKIIDFVSELSKSAKEEEASVERWKNFGNILNGEPYDQNSSICYNPCHSSPLFAGCQNLASGCKMTL